MDDGFEGGGDDGVWEMMYNGTLPTKQQPTVIEALLGLFASTLTSISAHDQEFCYHG